MLTAEKARELAGVDEVSLILDQILVRVEEFAKAKNRSAKIRGFCFDTDYMYNPKSKETGDKVIEKLNSLGFKTKLESPCGQFEDHYLVVSW